MTVDYSVALELRDLINRLQARGTPLCKEAAYAIERMGREYNWSGIRRRRWTTGEIRFLRAHTKKSTEYIASALGRTVVSIRWMRRQVRKQDEKN